MNLRNGGCVIQQRERQYKHKSFHAVPEIFPVDTVYREREKFSSFQKILISVSALKKRYFASVS
jgi:hypothetical protein